MKNLNLGNFWNSMKVVYPDAIEDFCVWIDEYKVQVDWNQTFGRHVKFHHIPFEMQVGVLHYYFSRKFRELPMHLPEGFRNALNQELITVAFSNLQSLINRSNEKAKSQRNTSHSLHSSRGL